MAVNGRGWVSVAEGARYLRMRREELESLVRQGTVPCTQRGGTRRVHTDDLDAYMRQFPYRGVA